MSAAALRVRAAALAGAVLAGCGGGGGAGVGGGGGGGADARGGIADGAPGPDADLGPPRTVHLIGRFDTSDPEAPRFSWPGTTIVARFDGGELAVDLDAAGPTWFSVWIDGDERPALVTGAGDATYPVASGLAAGEHDVVLTRRSESFFGVTAFRGFSGAALVATVRPYPRMIELVGDSITCGYGVLGDGPLCDFTGDTESEPAAWGGRAARALGAGHVAIAYSGKGVYRNRDEGDTATIPILFDRIFADDPGRAWGFDGYTPDAVVVNLGTNDFADGDPGQAYADAVDAFVQQIRGHYPRAYILVATSPMLGDGYPAGMMQRTHAHEHLAAAVAAAHGRGDDQVDLLELDEQLAADGYGCAYHPDEVTQQKMADALVAQLRAHGGW